MTGVFSPNSRPAALKAMLIRILGLVVLSMTSAPVWAEMAAAPADEERIAAALEEFDRAQALLEANPDEARRIFRNVATQLETIIARGVSNGKLEYNLGNAYLQAGDIGEAILHYRRAQRLIPRDPYLAHNLNLARERRVNQIATAGRDKLLRSLLFWHFDTTMGGRIRAAIALFAALWILLLIRNFVRSQAVAWCALAAGLFCAMSIGSVIYERQSNERTPPAVLLGTDVTVRKGPGEGYQKQFAQPLQAGVEFTVLEERGAWWRIELPDGNAGWVLSDSGERV